MSEQSLTGQKLGPYAIGPLVGEGGCATVYRARRATGGPGMRADQQVALKVFHPELVSDERTFQRFEREADLGIRIRHRHIVPTYEIGSAPHGSLTLHYIAMEFVEGETLREVLDELGTVPEDLLYQIADQVLDALAVIHAEGMVHRDVKPENIILTGGDQQVRVMDMGVARLQQEGRDLTLDGEFIGSLAYASPEQFTDQDHVDTRTDIYALGVLLYEMATGINPYDDSDLRGLIEKKLRQQVGRPRILNRDIDPFLDEVILACLEKDPGDRFPSCAALRDILAAREASPWWQARTVGESLPASTRALRRLRPPRAAPLVGRAEELAALHGAYESVKAGEGTVTLISGPSGIGKSRLVHDFLEDLVAPDGPVLLAGRYPEEAGRAHHPFLEAMRAYFGECAELPETDVPARVVAFVRERAAEGPVVLAIEDLHRADPESVSLLDPLVRAVQELPVQLVLTWIPNALDEGSPLHRWTTVQAAKPHNHSVALGPLDDEGVEALLSALVSNPRTARSLTYPVGRASSGVPHVLIEIVEHLRATGELVPGQQGLIPSQAIHDVGLPDSVRALLLVRLVDVEADSMQLLEAAAAQGPEFEATLLAAVTGQKRLRLLKRLAVLERRHRILESAGRGSFRFASHGLWQVIYEGMRDERRREVHAQCAAAIDTGGAPATGDAAFTWVSHLLAADRLADAGPAVPAAIEHATTQLHAARALGFLQRLHEALPQGEEALRLGVQTRLGALRSILDDAGDAATTPERGG